MSATDNIDKPDDSQVQNSEDKTLQGFAAPIQSNSHPEMNTTEAGGFDSARVEGGGFNRKRKPTTQCQICLCNLKNEKPYYQRYRICPTCSSIDRKDDLDGLLKRFCQQCGKFQAITLFDGNMRTCRERLDRHAARRRKSHARQAAIRRGTPIDDYEPEPAGSPHEHYSPSLGPQRRQYNSNQRYQGHAQHPYQRQSPYQQTATAVSNPMLDLLAHQILQQANVQRSWAEQQQQRAMQQHQQQQQQRMMEQLMASIATSRPSPANLLTPLYQPTPLRFSPSPHPHSFVNPAAIDPTTAEIKLKAVLALLLNEAAAAAAPAVAQPPQPRPTPPSPPPQQNEALQSMLQRLVAMASAGDNEAAAGPSASPTTDGNAAAPPTGNQPAPSLPAEIADLARAALAALVKQEEERSKPQQQQ